MNVKHLFFIAFLLCPPAFGQAYNDFDLSNSLIDKKHIIHGGPPRDGIPAISDPKYVAADEASFMKPDDVVLGFKTGNSAFAYPRHILNWHELVNDKSEGKGFVITYCPLCGSGMAFSSEVGSESLEFGVSGLLYNNDLLFYDRQTESLWSQIERRSVSGDFAGDILEQLYLEHTSWQSWKERYPNTKVLSEDQGFRRNYRHDPYTGYETSSQLFFKSLYKTPKEFHTKENVLGLTIGETAKAYPFSELRKQGLSRFEDELAGFRFNVIWDADANAATVESIDGKALTPTVAFWFAWYNFHPETKVFRASDSKS